MKKYKLIKEYPNSPKLGYVTTVLGGLGSQRYEKYPDFWEEIDQTRAEFKILTLVDNETQEHKYVGDYKLHNIANLLFFGKHSWCIQSVLRLFDNQIFSKGDRVNTPIDNSFCAIYSIYLNTDRELNINCTHNFLLKEQGFNDILSVIQKPINNTKNGNKQ